MKVDDWQIDTLPLYLRDESSPLPELSEGVKATLNAMQHRPFGATTAKLAFLSGVSRRHTLRCLNDLLARGWATHFRTAILKGGRVERLWQLSDSASCQHVLSFMKLRPVRTTPHNDRVPQEFWRWFWSGAPGDSLRVSLDAVHIAAVLIESEDPCARSWALTQLPTKSLEQCRLIRGFENTQLGDLIDRQLAHRRESAS